MSGYVHPKDCSDSKLCGSALDAARRGGWFFQINVLGTKRVDLGGSYGDETVAGAFEVLQFGPTFGELDYYEQDEDHQLLWQVPAIYNKLEVIRNSEAMAFVKLAGDRSSIKLADLQRGHRPFSLTFSLTNFGPHKGGRFQMVADFGLDLTGVFILDVKKAGAAEKVLITFSDSRLQGSMPSRQR